MLLTLLCHAPFLSRSWVFQNLSGEKSGIEKKKLARRNWIQGSTVCSTNSTEQSHPLHRPQKVCQSGARACEAWEQVKRTWQKHKNLQKTSGTRILIVNSFSVFSLMRKYSETMLQRNLHCSKEPRSLFSASPSQVVDLF